MKALIGVKHARRVDIAPVGYDHADPDADVPPKLLNALQKAQLDVEIAERAILTYLADSGQSDAIPVAFR